MRGYKLKITPEAFQEIQEAIDFTINDTSRTIIIQAVLSHFRDPDTHWKKRK